MAKPPVADLGHLALPGAEIACRVTPGARQAGLSLEEGVIRVQVNVVPEDGAANRAVAELLARALGVAKTRLELVRGAKSRDKLFRLLP